MKKKTIIPLVIVVIIIIGTIIIITLKKYGTKRLYKLHKELETSQMYLLEMAQNEKIKTIMAKKADKTVIDQYSNDEHTTTIVTKHNVYFVSHSKEEYSMLESNNIYQSILLDGLKEVTNKELIVGKEKILGKKYWYEEYNGSTIFMIASTLDTNEENIKTRFYFDNNDNLVYIRTIKGAKQELLKIKIEKEVNDEIFQMPSNYAEN